MEVEVSVGGVAARLSAPPQPAKPAAPSTISADIKKKKPDRRISGYFSVTLKKTVPTEFLLPL